MLLVVSEKKSEKYLQNTKCSLYLHSPNGDKILKTNAEVAQLVEHNLAKVGVAGSSLVFRSGNSRP